MCVENRVDSRKPPAPQGHDIGNHFCEYAGFECDYSRYPGQAAAELFLRHYLAAGQEGCSPDRVVSREAACFKLYRH